VIGILADSPALREFGPPPEVYVPFNSTPIPATRELFKVVARLNRGVRLEQAKARLQASASEYRARFPETLGPTRVLPSGFFQMP